MVYLKIAHSRSTRLQMFFEIGVFKNLTKFGVEHTRKVRFGTWDSGHGTRQRFAGSMNGTCDPYLGTFT